MIAIFLVELLKNFGRGQKDPLKTCQPISSSTLIYHLQLWSIYCLFHTTPSRFHARSHIPQTRSEAYTDKRPNEWVIIERGLFYSSLPSNTRKYNYLRRIGIFYLVSTSAKQCIMYTRILTWLMIDHSLTIARNCDNSVSLILNAYK